MTRCAKNVARLYRLYPRKEVLPGGSDADIAVVDMNRREKFQAASTKIWERHTASLFENLAHLGGPLRAHAAANGHAGRAGDWRGEDGVLVALPLMKAT